MDRPGAAIVSAAAILGILHGRAERRPAAASMSGSQSPRTERGPRTFGTSKTARHQPPPKLNASSATNDSSELRIAAEATPGSATYNPRKMVRVMGARPLFHNEPRLHSWAPQVEAWLKTHISEDFKKRLGLDVEGAVECHTATCRIVIPPEMNFSEGRRLLETYYTPSMSSANPAARSVYFVYGPGASGPHSDVPVGNAEATIAAMERIRDVKVTSPDCVETAGRPDICP